MAVFKARQVIEQSAHQVQQIIESLPQMAWTANADGYINYLNKRWYNYTRQKLEQLASNG